MAIKTNLTSLLPAREQFKQEIVLLSKGYSIPKIAPGGRITVYPWDHEVDDWIIQNRKVNFNTIIFEIAKKLVGVDNIDDFVVGDVTTILLVGRSLNKQTAIEYDTKCPECGVEEHIIVKIPDQLEKHSEKPDTYNGQDEIVLPVSKDRLVIRQVLVRDQLAVLQRDPISQKKISDRVLRNAMIIVSVNGGAPESIDEAVSYVRALPPEDSKYLNKQIDDLTPKLDTNIKHQCPNCKHVYARELELDTNFFR